MAKESFFTRLMGKSLKDDEGPTSEEIDREVENAVTAIKAKKQDMITATSVLRSQKSGGEDDTDRVFLLDLAPMFSAIGSRTGRVADRLREECPVVFEKHRKHDKDLCSLEADLFLMRFPGTPNIKGFQRAALVVNEIGKDILGNQFESMELPGLLTVARPKDLADSDDEFSAKLAKTVIADGGTLINMGEPSERAPNWLKLQWTSNMNRSAEFRAQPLQYKKKQASHSHHTPAQRLKRSAEDRRHGAKPFHGRDRRHTFDRRGRGY